VDTVEEMRIYIANLGKYNEGELVGAWFTPPIDFDEVKERISLNDEYEEYAIHDYELPFEIDEYTPIEEVNRLCEMVEDLPEDIQAELHELQSYFGGIEELCGHEDDIIHYPDCEDMADVARYFIEETGALGEVPASLQNYIDYEAYGRDLEISGSFVVTNHGVFEITR
jgi:antirestriction protein